MNEWLGSEQRGDRAEAADVAPSLWAAFARARDNRERSKAWLALQCKEIGGVVTAALLLRQPDGSYRPTAVWPERRDATHLGGVVEKALAERRGTILESENGYRFHIAYPLEVENSIEAVAALDLIARPHAELQSALRRLHWGIGWVESLLWRDEAIECRRRVERSAVALELLAVIEDHDRLPAAAISLVNAAAERFACDRVWMGIRRRERMRVYALSHSASFKKSAGLIRAVESAMDEAAEQGQSVVHPAPSEGPRRIDAAHRDLATKGGLGAVASVPLLSQGRYIGVLTFERESGSAFAPELVALAEATATLIGPVIGMKRRARRWLSGRIPDAIGDIFVMVFGPRYPTLKLGVLAGTAVLAYLATATAEFRVTARAALEGEVQRAAVAPFDGYVIEAPVRAGERVVAGALLARLDDRDLRLEVTRWRSELESLEQQYKEALAAHKRAQMGVLDARVRQARAQLALAEDRLARTRITAPNDGIIVSGDLSQMLGSPVSQGDLLFEIAPLDVYRVALRIDEHDLRFVERGQSGNLVLTGLGNTSLPIKVTRLTSVAEAANGINAFRAEASLEAKSDLLRPGMEGVAKIAVEERPLRWVWTRKLVDWGRLTFWKLTP